MCRTRRASSSRWVDWLGWARRGAPSRVSGCLYSIPFSCIIMMMMRRCAVLCHAWGGR
jgi:hypothetical protein